MSGEPKAALLAFGLSALALPASAQEPRFHETVTVQRFVVDVRVVDGAGRPIVGLQPSAFRVKVDGRPVSVESASWVSASEPYAEGLSPAEAAELGGRAAPRGRLIVLLFQKSAEPSRVSGLLRMLAEAGRMLDTLAPQDRVAVLTFDSHLRLWQDFTSDHDRLHWVLDRLVLFGAHPAAAAEPEPSLAGHFDVPAARRAASLEKALEILGDALSTLPGSKSLALLGWGLGRYSAGLVHMEPDYEPARRALSAARVSVFSLDVTNADYHSLEVGLMRIAEDTGGFYEKTHVFSGQAMKRLEYALSGHYVLAFEAPERGEGTRRRSLSIDLAGRSGTVLAARFLED